MKRPYVIKHIDDVSPVECPCGAATRIITAEDNDLLSIHRVVIKTVSYTHLTLPTSDLV